MDEITITISQLRCMIGQCIRHQGLDCEIIEVLEYNTELVLQVQHPERTIQPNQHGDAHRRVPETITIPVLTADKSELHPVFLALDLL